MRRCEAFEKTQVKGKCAQRRLNMPDSYCINQVTIMIMIMIHDDNDAIYD